MKNLIFVSAVCFMCLLPCRADLLIAIIALANHGTLVTRNLKDFRLVPGLQVENWAD